MYIHTPSKSLILKVRDPFAIRELLPTASKIVNFPDGHNVVVKWTLDSARLLRNIGIAAPSPIVSYYAWPGLHKPMPHQVEMASFTTLYDKCFNLSEQGTGKTYATLWALDYLMTQGAIKRALIMCPLSTVQLTWMQDIFKILPHRVASAIHGTKQTRMKNLRRPVDIYVLNHDGIVIEDVVREVKRRKDIDMVVVDEASFYRNAGIDKTRFLKWATETKTRLLLMSGTPCPNAPTDAWSLSKLVCPHLSPPFFGNFRDEIMWQDNASGKWFPKKGASERAYEIMQPAIRFRKRDCIDLPPLIGPRDVETRLSDEQRSAAKQMRDEMIAYAAEHQITAVNGADKLNKMRQILLGCVKDTEAGEYRMLDCSYRIRDLRNLISQASAKVLVIVPFKGILQVLIDELAKPDKHTGTRGYKLLPLNGDVTTKDRIKNVTQFKTDPSVDGLCCHARVMSHGLNLTEADTTIFYGPIDSNDQYGQVVERFNRLGQKFPMNLVRLVANPLEAAIYQKVDDRGSMQNSILELYNKVINDKDDHL